LVSYLFPLIFRRDLRPDPRINYSTPLRILRLRVGNRVVASFFLSLFFLFKQNATP
jgi:hypothetical protein